MKNKKILLPLMVLAFNSCFFQQQAISQDAITETIIYNNKTYTGNISDDVKIDARNVTLQNANINADIILKEQSIDSILALENVKVDGDIKYPLNARNWITLKNSQIKGKIVAQTKAYDLNIESDKLDYVKFGSEIIIKGQPNSVVNISADPKKDFEIEYILLSTANGNKKYISSASFKMPSDEVKIFVKIKGLYSFSTDHNIYTIENARLTRTKPSLLAADDLGYLLAYTQKGKKLWQSKVCNTLITKIAPRDINGDGKDEIALSSQDSNVYLLDSKGKTLWKFETLAPVNSVAIAKDSNGEFFVFAGGIDKYLYKISLDGKLVDKRKMSIDNKVPLIIRNFTVADLNNDGNESIIIGASAHISGVNSIIIVSPDDIQKEKYSIRANKSSVFKGAFFGRYAVGDMNNDNKIDIALPDGVSNSGRMVILDPELKTPIEVQKRFKGIQGRGYRMGNAHFFDSKGNKQLFEIFGNQLAEINEDFKIEKLYTNRYAYTNSALDNKSGNFLIGSTHSGGDSIHIIDMNSKAGLSLFEAIQSSGRMAEVEDNVAALTKQIDTFELPEYQKLRNSGFVADDHIGGTPSILYPNNVIEFVRSFQIPNKPWNWLEVFDRKGTLPAYLANKIDGRRTTLVSTEEILNGASIHEKNNEPFSVWAGHGNNPFYMSADTAVKMIETAPKTLKLLVYPELAGTVEASEYIIENLFLPLAKKAKEENSSVKVYLRNKGMFWSSQVNTKDWYNLFHSKYSKALMPAMEESNSRIQEVSVAGRVGVWLTTDINNWSSRQIEDNAIYNRQYQWAQQQVQTHYMRAILNEVANGAKTFQGGGVMTRNYSSIIYRLIDAHALLAGQKDNVISNSDFVLAFKNIPNEPFENAMINGNYVAMFSPDELKETYVFDRVANYWAGVETLDHDFSRYALGVTHRRLNYLPLNPYGLIPHVSERLDIKSSQFKDRAITDGKYWYDESGKKYSAPDYKDVAVKKLAAAKKRLPLFVEGCCWTAQKLDDKHIRLYLVDPGYITPHKRNAVVTLQNIKATKATNILTKQQYNINNDKIEVEIPAGIFSIVDLEI